MMIAEVCHHDEAGMKEWWECSEMWLEWKDISVWVSMEERPSVVEWDMEALVEAKVELVGSMDLTERSAGADSWMSLDGSSYKVRAENL